jgi:predicted MFS family arabinose efflux permease
VRSTLKSPRLRRILAAYTVNRLGTWFGYVALSLAVFEHTHSAVAVAVLLVAGEALPAFLVLPLVAWVEASSGRAKLSALYLFEGLVTVALAFLLWHFWLPAVLVLAALDGTAALAASSLLRAETARAAREQAHEDWGAERDGKDPEAFAQEAERKANAALNIAFSGTFMLGPVLAGVVVAIAGGPVALLIDAASFLICGALLIDLRSYVEEAAGASVRGRLRAAWDHINEVLVLRMLLLTEGFALVFLASDGSIEVPYAKATLHTGDGGYGLLLTAWGVGVVVGSLVFARAVRRPLGTMLSAGTLAVGLAYVGFAAAPSLPVACFAGFVGGVGNGVQWASMLSAVQQLTPQHLQGRMMGAVESLGSLCLAIGLLLGGVLVALSSPRVAFLVAGLGAAMSTVAFMRLSLRVLKPAVSDEGQTEVVDSSARQLHEPSPH